MQLSDYLDVKELNDDLDKGYVVKAKHNHLPLDMYTYSRSAQYDSYWSDATRKSRGLVVARNSSKIVAFCMPKFFNKSEHDNGKSYAGPIPLEPFKVFAKKDGSMGTVFHYDGEWHVATKGSFHSDQAIFATNLLRSRNTSFLAVGTTYVVEIIYPENRIVCDYGDTVDLVLLTTYSSLGSEFVNSDTWNRLGFSTVEEFRSCGLLDLDHLCEDNLSIEGEKVVGTDEEGYVLRFESGTRVKVKFDDYLALHKILTNCTERSVWEAMYNNADMSQFFENVPDEFDTWVRSVMSNIENKVRDFEIASAELYNKIVDTVGTEDRKAFALEALKLEPIYKSAMFTLLDGKSLRDLAFKQCYPAAVKPFRQDSDV